MLGVHILMFLQESSRDTASSNNSKLVNSHISNRPLNYGPILPIFTFGIFPIQQCESHHLLAEETAIQAICQPKYNSPWISPLLKKFHIGKQLYGPSNPVPCHWQGTKALRRYRKRTLTILRLVFCPIAYAITVQSTSFCMNWGQILFSNLSAPNCCDPTRLILSMFSRCGDVQNIYKNPFALEQEHNYAWC